MQKSITISVITVTYNAEGLLQRTLDSVGRQTYTDIEHLIIDGASKDGTLDMAQAYSKACSYPVVVKSEKDRGIYDAMNKGLALATGDYLVFLNAGDVLHEAETLEKVVACVRKNMTDPSLVSQTTEGTTMRTPAVVYGDTAIVDCEGRFLRLRRLRPPKHLSWRSFRWGMLVCHQSFYVSTSLAKFHRYDLTYRHSADVDWCIRIMKHAQRQKRPLVNAGCILSDFMEGGNTTQNHRASLKERFRVMRQHYGLGETVLLHLWFVVRAVLKK